MRDLLSSSLILLHKTFLLGEKVTLADIHLLPGICRILRAASKIRENEEVHFEPLKPFPSLQRWLDHMRDQKGFTAAYPPHWT